MGSYFNYFMKPTSTLKIIWSSMYLYYCDTPNVSIALCFFPWATVSKEQQEENQPRPYCGMKEQAIFCIHLCSLHPLNNCKELLHEESLFLLPFIPRIWNENRHSKRACWVHLLGLTDVHIQRDVNTPSSALLPTCCCSSHVFLTARSRSTLSSFCSL